MNIKSVAHPKRISDGLLWALRLRRGTWEWKPYNRGKVRYKFLYWYYTGELLMKNRSFIIGLGFLALAMQAFTLICSGALKQGYIDGFSAASVITLALALLLSLWNQRSSCDIAREIGRAHV